MIINLNGRLVGRSDAKISIFDHGFLYGASIYESMRTYGGKPFQLMGHYQRLASSARGVHLILPFDFEEFHRQLRMTLAQSEAAESAIRVIVTRGAGDPGYAPAKLGPPAFIFLVSPLPPVPPGIYEKGVTLSLVSVRRNLPEALDPAVKSGNLLNQMLAWNEAHSRNAYEALMLNYRGELTECTMCNLFVVRNKILRTPALECGILAGITRQLILEVASESGLTSEESILYPEDLYGAEEAFLTVTSREIIPVVRCDDHTIGNGYPGTTTRFLHLKYRQKVREIMEQEAG
jgi:branched-chain amino acid aminotransferase